MFGGPTRRCSAPFPTFQWTYRNIFSKAIAVSTVAVRAADLESPEKIAELRRAVRVPEGGDNSYFFLILSSGDMTRYYPFRIATPR